MQGNNYELNSAVKNITFGETLPPCRSATIYFKLMGIITGNSHNVLEIKL